MYRDCNLFQVPMDVNERLCKSINVHIYRTTYVHAYTFQVQRVQSETLLTLYDSSSSNRRYAFNYTRAYRYCVLLRFPVHN